MRLEARFWGEVKPLWEKTHRFPLLRLHTHDTFTHKRFYKGKGLYTEMVLCREMILQNFTKGFFYTEVLLHRDAVNTNMLVRAGALGRKYFYTGDDCAKRNLQTQARLHTGAFAQRCFYIELFLHTNTLRSAVTYKFFCAEILLHASTFTQTYFDTH